MFDQELYTETSPHYSCAYAFAIRLCSRSTPEGHDEVELDL